MREILKDIDWENSVVNMAHPADYRFAFQFKNPEIKSKTVLYELWISPRKKKIELVIDTENKYAQIDKKKSAALFEILTGEKLSEPK
ncbi:hypothetical protein [Calidifontibacillus erzurumensis]|uniref:hypothetical protein n=1 Tax=Calidifontibacillus erzurumensis TaxID=2741433 RepID=UPI0035B53BA8